MKAFGAPGGIRTYDGRLRRLTPEFLTNGTTYETQPLCKIPTSCFTGRMVTGVRLWSDRRLFSLQLSLIPCSSGRVFGPFLENFRECWQRDWNSASLAIAMVTVPQCTVTILDGRGKAFGAIRAFGVEDDLAKSVTLCHLVSYRPKGDPARDDSLLSCGLTNSSALAGNRRFASQSKLNGNGYRTLNSFWVANLSHCSLVSETVCRIHTPR